MGKRILIVDDEPLVLQVLQGFFDCFEHGHRYEVEAASDGASALMAVMRRDFDLILLDMYMPGLSGLDLLKQIRGFGVQAPVLLITGNRDPQVAAEALRGGIFAYVPKPVDLLRLDHVVALALATSESVAGARAQTPAQAVAGPVSFQRA